MSEKIKQSPNTCAQCSMCGNPPTPICSKLYWEGDWGSDATCVLHKGEKFCEHYLNKHTKTYNKL